MVVFLDGFLRRGWPFFYRTAVAFLQDMEEELLQEDLEGALVLLTQLPEIYSGMSRKSWERLLNI